MIFKRLVKQKHLADGAIAVLAHALLVFVDSRQQNAVLLCGRVLAIGLKSAPL